MDLVIVARCPSGWCCNTVLEFLCGSERKLAHTMYVDEQRVEPRYLRPLASRTFFFGVCGSQQQGSQKKQPSACFLSATLRHEGADMLGSKPAQHKFARVKTASWRPSSCLCLCPCGVVVSWDRLPWHMSQGRCWRVFLPLAMLCSECFPQIIASLAEVF